jgi:hypothetical protein
VIASVDAMRQGAATMIDERIDRETDETRLHADGRSDLTRRGLLAGAASSVALATSGLLLPDWLLEAAAADNHPVRRVQRRREQRRRKQRNEQQRNNDRREREQSSNDDKPPGADLYGFAGIQFNVYLLGTPTMNIEYFQLETGSSDEPWFRKEAGDVTYPPGKTYQSEKTPLIDMPDCFLWIEKKVYIRAQNPCCSFPLVKLGYGGKVNKGSNIVNQPHYKTDGWKDGTCVVGCSAYGKEMPVGGASDMQTPLGYVRIQRLKDANDYIVFQVDIM